MCLRIRQKTGLGPSTEVLSFASPPDRRPKASTQRKGDPTICVPALRCGQTCVTPFRLRCRPTRCAALPLRSDRRRQASSRCNAVLRQRCPHPEPRAAGADTRVDAGGQRELRRNQPQTLIHKAIAAIKIIKKLSRIRIRCCPLCPRLRRQALAACGCTAECRRFVL